jgi:hypothetical protein
MNRTPLLKEKLVKEYFGNVKRIIEYDCDRYFTNENPIKINKNSCKITSIENYDINEMLLKQMEWYGSNYPNDTDNIIVNKLNEAGLTYEWMHRWNSVYFGKLTEQKVLYSYNKDGFITDEVVYQSGKYLWRKEYNYDEYNCPIKEILYDSINKIESYYVRSFDLKNRETLSIKYNNKDKLIEKVVTEYDDDYYDFDGWVIRTTYDGDGKLIEHEDKLELYKNNKIDGGWTPKLPYKGAKDVEYYSSGKVKSWHFQNSSNEDVYQIYNENGRIIERKIYRNETWLETYTWNYREDGALVEQSESTSKIVGTSYYKKTTNYKLDFNGNWIEKIVFDSEDNVSLMRVREIEYFN